MSMRSIVLPENSSTREIAGRPRESNCDQEATCAVIWVPSEWPRLCAPCMARGADRKGVPRPHVPIPHCRVEFPKERICTDLITPDALPPRLCLWITICPCHGNIDGEKKKRRGRDHAGAWAPGGGQGTWGVSN